ncbi:aminoacyl-histidine dipeptidase [Butyrivibrio sp. INlla16]|uniref:aminoacyl-histidine dipeptidase n=1 Tax=Butyrivibrio sp. INlla16 TaxID=1520807 RepID=UPI0008846AAB|nr:aminoacyl-histidine dipeptidase [Butyrivibrio sp. INlla16]SDB03040.1 dipeptidase D [Butyrivibrio sp. INlla16]
MAFEKLQPTEVFKWFEEICNIPHGSGNLKKISSFLVKFAKDRDLYVRQDNDLNVIIKKPGTKGYEKHAPVILQGHMDMVAVKEKDAKINMEKDGLDVKTDGEFVWADKTSLGGDDGIAVAYCLALLDSKKIPHPPLEVIITTNEEVGMDGAMALKCDDIEGKRMINIDNEEEGVMIVSCAGGARFHGYLPLTRENKSGIKVKIHVKGLQGGHSGEMIGKGRGNANVIMGRLLLEITDALEVGIISLNGGVADNAIATDCEAELLLMGLASQMHGNIVGPDVSFFSLFGKLSSIAYKVESDFKAELGSRDPGLSIVVEEVHEKTLEPEKTDISNMASVNLDSSVDTFTETHEKREAVSGVIPCAEVIELARCICAMPYGVQSMSSSIEGLVETSLNLGILKIVSSQTGAVEGKGAASQSAGTMDEAFLLDYSVRSSVAPAKEALIRKMEIIIEGFNGIFEVTGEYPGWAYAEKSELRDTMAKVYKELYKKDIRIEAIHAGLECGLFSEKIDGLDCVSIGPDMQDIHSTGEKLSVASTKRTWEYLCEVLKAL